MMFGLLLCWIKLLLAESSTPPAVQELLTQYQDIFADPKTLPLLRVHDEYIGISPDMVD